MQLPTQKPKLFVQTFGCQMNTADSEEMSRTFLNFGFTLVPSAEKADVVLLNTCTVRQHAEQRALSYIGRLKFWKKNNPRRILIVAGCVAERLKKSLRHRFPQIDLVIGSKSIEEFPKLLESYFSKNGNKFNWFEESEKLFGEGELRFDGAPLVLGSQEKSALVTIMRGCNYSCSYCVVPSVRGKEIYRPPDKIMEEIRFKISQGKNQIILLGQTVNSYLYKEKTEDGKLKTTDFSDLLKMAEEIKEIKEIRFMSPHPHYMSDKLIHALSQLKKVTHEIHLPVQSGSNKILRRMKRNYTREEFLSIASQLKKAVPKLALGTDFIVGFPGETEDDFNATLSLADELDLGTAFCFKYSARPGTNASDLLDDVSEEEKEKRLSRLLRKVKTVARPVKSTDKF